MMDIYATIAVGSALILGMIPLIRPLKTGNWDNFLVVCYVDKQKFKEYLIQIHKDGDWID